MGADGDDVRVGDLLGSPPALDAETVQVEIPRCGDVNGDLRDKKQDQHRSRVSNRGQSVVSPQGEDECGYPE